MSHDIDSLYQKTNICQPEQKSTLRGNFRPALDLYSTLHKTEKRCVNDAPIVFVMDTSGNCQVKQSCCNSWNCPRCGEIRAKHEYARIINGATVLTEIGLQLFFLTLTCRGKDMPLSVAENEYYTWTNKLLNNCRNRSKRQNMPFHYVQVTERQKRLHPHSHLISTFCPDDAIETTKTMPDGTTRKILVSQWFIKRNVSSGLGSQCEITAIREPQGASRYVAKYLFKTAVKETWPPKWKRVRYSRKWPQLSVEKPELSFPLFAYDDWRRMDNIGVNVYTDNFEYIEMGKARGVSCLRLSARSEKE